jgi:hypothetical protein
MNLSIPYNLEFVNVVATFLEEMGACYGADAAEKQRLRLIGEEAFSFILVGIPDQDFSEMFQLRCTEIDDRLSLSFSNHGRPMNVREVKDFSVDDMEGTADGLSLRLLQGLCDQLLFQNLGRDGWELAIQFKLKNYKPILSGTDEADEALKPGISYDFTVRHSETDDIPGIINLVYNTYRYSYAKSFAYSKELFQEAMDNGKIFSMVVATADQKIIGHQAILFESPQLGEVGMAMVDPAYRKSRAYLLLKRDMKEEVMQKYPNVILYIKAVTSHKSSQAFMAGASISLLELSVYNHASFVGMKAGHSPRESLIYGFVTFSPHLPLKPIYIPEEHHEMVSSFFASTAISLQVEKNNGTVAFRESVFEVKENPENQHAKLYFSTIGNDFSAILKKQTRLLQQDGIISIHAIVPTHENQPEDSDRLLASNGYFFSGIKPNANGEWDLIYTNLLHQKFNFDDIQLFSPKAVELCNYIKEQYERTT